MGRDHGVSIMSSGRPCVAVEWYERLLAAFLLRPLLQCDSTRGRQADGLERADTGDSSAYRRHFAGLPMRWSFQARRESEVSSLWSGVRPPERRCASANRPSCHSHSRCLSVQRQASTISSRDWMKTTSANKSLQPTPVGVFGSADAGHVDVVVPAWLSFSR